MEITGCRRTEREKGGGLRGAASLSSKQVKDNGIQTGVEAEIQVFAICAAVIGLKLESEAEFCLWNKAGQGLTVLQRSRIMSRIKH